MWIEVFKIRIGWGGDLTWRSTSVIVISSNRTLLYGWREKKLIIHRYRHVFSLNFLSIHFTKETRVETRTRVWKNTHIKIFNLPFFVFSHFNSLVWPPIIIAHRAHTVHNLFYNKFHSCFNENVFVGWEINTKSEKSSKNLQQSIS